MENEHFLKLKFEKAFNFGTTFDSNSAFEEQFIAYCKANYLMMHVEDGHLMKDETLKQLK